MSSSMDTQEFSKSSLCSNPTRKVRVIAKIRGFTAQESQCSNSWISIAKNSLSDKVTVSFTGDQPTSRGFEVDHCYEQDEDTSLIFSREIKPLIQDVFDGKRATFIGFGARGSGKTYVIQGSEENPGLATLAVAEILSMAEEAEKFVAVSLYEVFQDHVYDILDPNRPEVQVLENAQGKIKLKGLSRVSVKSITEFLKLYHSGCSTVKATQKIGLEQPRRSHKGLMIHILSCDETSNMKLVGKMNFVDLAGYEDCRRKGKTSSESLNNVESTKINKSLYAFLNVVHALNANENRVPYRESKLTRVLQDSLGGTNHVLILTCLNPLICQDTAYAMSLASRACHGINHVLTDSTNRSKSSSKPTVVSSMKKVKLLSLSATAKKQTNIRLNLSQNKSSNTEGRKLFDERNQSINCEQVKSHSDVPLDKTPEEHEPLSASIVKKTKLATKVEKETSLSSALGVEPNVNAEKESSSSIADEAPGTLVTYNKDLQLEDNLVEDTLDLSYDTKALTLFEGDSVQEEDNNLDVDEGGSPPLSTRLKELSMNLKSLCSSTPSCVTKPQEFGTPCSGQVICYGDSVEPRTPVVERPSDKRALAKFESPRETFTAHSSGMKQSLVHGCLQILNSASKEELKGLRGIGEKRATYILELREESPEPFKCLDDLRDIGMSAKQIKVMMKTVAGGIFD